MQGPGRRPAGESASRPERRVQWTGSQRCRSSLETHAAKGRMKLRQEHRPVERITDQGAATPGDVAAGACQPPQRVRELQVARGCEYRGAGALQRPGDVD